MRNVLSLVAALSLAFLAGCSTVGQTITGIKNFDEVSPTLYRGAQPTEQGFQTLAARHVKTVINLRETDDPHEAALVQAAGMNYLSLPQDASKATLADAENFLALLAAAPSPVFVHCHAGRDRTGLAIAAYRLRIQQWTRQAALGDLYAHGHNWVFFPKVRAVIDTLAKLNPPIPPSPSARNAPLADVIQPE